MTAVSLLPGAKYYGGVKRPWFISQATVNGWMLARGFRGIVWHKRADPLPWDVNPRKDLEYSDDWDEWLFAVYGGPQTILAPPAKPAWLIVNLPPSATPAAAQAAAQSAAEQAARWAAGQASAANAAAQAAAESARRTSTAATPTPATRPKTAGAPPAVGGPNPDRGVAAALFTALVLGAVGWVMLRKRPRV